MTDRGTTKPRHSDTSNRFRVFPGFCFRSELRTCRRQFTHRRRPERWNSLRDHDGNCDNRRSLFHRKLLPSSGRTTTTTAAATTTTTPLLYGGLLIQLELFYSHLVIPASRFLVNDPCVRNAVPRIELTPSALGVAFVVIVVYTRTVDMSYTFLWLLVRY